MFCPHKQLCGFVLNFTPHYRYCFETMKKILKTTKLLHIGMSVALIVLTGCASIVSKSNWPVNFKSNPPGAEVVITDNMGNEVERGRTPTTITLKSSDGFFSGATYYAEFKLKDYEIAKKGIHADLNGWYFGNIFLPGGLLLGMVIIDPATGAMYRLAPLCTVNLNKVER